ncbi:Tyrosine recombinase XerC [subsurface metagenome]
MTTRPKTLTVTECDQILEALCNRKARGITSRKGIRNRTMVLLMLDAGLRVGEVVALDMTDLYFGLVPVETLTVRAAISKTKIERTIPLSDQLQESLMEFARIVEDWFLTSRSRYAFEGNVPGQPLTTRQVERIVTKAAMKTIGRPVHPHIFRHTFASRLNKKTSLRTVQVLLGHKHITSTQIYTHPDQQDLKNAIATLDQSQDSQ